MAQDTHAALETLFYPFKNGTLPWPEGGERCGFINARLHPALGEIQGPLTLQQYFKPYAQILQDNGHAVRSEWDLKAARGQYDYILVVCPKNAVEARYVLAAALESLKDGGMLVTAADNKAGGARLAKMLQAFGDLDVYSESKNKCRVVWAVKENADQAVMDGALKEGGVQGILSGTFQSQPGIFGWNKVDKGSELLVQHLPEDLKGHGADFGCGYGYLAAEILKTYEPESLNCIDADYRAVQMCQQNLAQIETKTMLRFFWEDLTSDHHFSDDLDFVVMNPPFHEGKKADILIGQKFIETAHAALHTGGALWMVANAHLPYEEILNSNFQKVERKYEGQGFKIYAAVK